LFHNAAAAIVAHNHPSGDPTPSRADETITSRLQDALSLIDVRLLDHIIVGDTTFSLAESGKLSC
jgi:DNA repair protein RadC